MTRIDSHVSQPELARLVQKPSASHDDRQDFLEHLHADRPAEHEPGKRADKRMPAIGDKRTLGSDTKVDAGDVQLRVSDRPDAATPMDAGIGAAEMPGIDNALQAAHHAASAIAGATTHTRVFEQHWFANGYLSFIAEAEEGGGSGRSWRAAGMQERLPSTAPESAVPPTVMHVGGERSDVTATWPVVVEGPGGRADTPARSVERMARALGPLMVADQPWPERLMRLSQKPGGKVVLWVRDYALSPSGIDPLVAHLRQLARREGVVLDRVMVNGTAVWQSESFKGEV